MTGLRYAATRSACGREALETAQRGSALACLSLDGGGPRSSSERASPMLVAPAPFMRSEAWGDDRPQQLDHNDCSKGAK